MSRTPLLLCGTLLAALLLPACGTDEAAPVATPSSLVFTSASVAFTPVATETTGEVVAAIRNNGTEPETITAILIEGADAAAFSVINPAPLPMSVAAGAEITMTLRFAPVRPGSATAMLRVQTSRGSVAVPVTAQAAQSATAICLDVDTLDFGSVNPDNNPYWKALSVVNCGSTPLAFDTLQASAATSPVAITGTGASAFWCTVQSYSMDVIAPGDSGVVMVQFSAATPGAATAVLTLTDVARITSASVVLRGTSTPAAFPALPDSIDFGTVPVNTQNDTALTLTNTLTAPIIVSFSNGGEFRSLITEEMTIAPGASYSWTLRFSSTVAGPFRSALLCNWRSADSKGYSGRRYLQVRAVAQ